MGYTVLAIVDADPEPEAVELGGFDSEAAGLAATREAQAQGLIVREPEGVTVIPAFRIVRYVVGFDGIFPSWSGRRTGRRRASPARSTATVVEVPAAVKARPVKKRAR